MKKLINKVKYLFSVFTWDIRYFYKNYKINLFPFGFKVEIDTKNYLNDDFYYTTLIKRIRFVFYKTSKFAEHKKLTLKQRAIQAFEDPHPSVIRHYSDLVTISKKDLTNLPLHQLTKKQINEFEEWANNTEIEDV